MATEAERVGYVGQALETLKKAIAAGFTDADALKNDAALASIRDREEFKKLLALLEADRLAQQATGDESELAARQMQADAQRRLLELDRASLNHQVTLAATLHAIGLIQLSLKKNDEAEKSLREAIKIHESQHQPQDTAVTRDYLATRIALGELYLHTERLSEGRKLLQETLRAIDELAAKHADNAALQQQLAVLEQTTREHYGQIALRYKAELDSILGDFRQILRLRAGTDPGWLNWVSCWLPAVTCGTNKLSGIVFASDMPWVRSTCGYGRPDAVRVPKPFGRDLAGLPYSNGIGTHAFGDATPADVVINISSQKFAAFKAQAGLLDHGSVQFQVLVDGKVKHETPVMRYGAVEPISVEVSGAKEVNLRVLNGGDGSTCDSAGWGYARFVQASAEDPLEVPPTELRSATDANAAFFLAEVHGRLDQKDLARRWFDKAAAWMDKNKNEAEKLRPFRAEAAQLLGITEKVRTVKDNSQKTK